MTILPASDSANSDSIWGENVFWRLSVISLLCVSGISCWLFANDPGAPAHEPVLIECPRTLTIRGAKANEVVTRQIDIQSVSKKEIEIIEIYSTCSCTETRLSNRIVTPGGKVNLQVKMITGKDGSIRSVVSLIYHLRGKSEVFTHSIEIGSSDVVT